MTSAGNEGDEPDAFAQSSKEARLLARRKARRKRQKKKGRELAAVETGIISLEEEIRRLEEEMCTEEVYSTTCYPLLIRRNWKKQSGFGCGIRALENYTKVFQNRCCSIHTLHL